MKNKQSARNERRKSCEIQSFHFFDFNEESYNNSEEFSHCKELLISKVNYIIREEFRKLMNLKMLSNVWFNLGEISGEKLISENKKEEKSLTESKSETEKNSH